MGDETCSRYLSGGWCGRGYLIEPEIFISGHIRTVDSWWSILPEPVAGVPHALFHLSLLLADRRVAELRLKQIVADHRLEPLVDESFLAPAHLVLGGLHVVVDSCRNGGRLGIWPVTIRAQ